MRELQEILQKVDQLRPDERAVLVTVVDVQGSGYRLAGARMLVDENGSSIGSVSGGCLEADVLERAKKVLKDRLPTVVTYDSTKDENSIFGLQMGCRGIVRILIEPAVDNELFSFFRTCFEKRKRGAIATLIAKSNGHPLPVASRFFWPHKGDSNGLLPKAVGADVQRSLLESRSHTQNFETPDGDLEFFIEVVKPPTSIMIFGGGDDAMPLSALAKQLGWHVNVVDRRPAYTTRERFPDADRVIVSRAEDLADEFFSDHDSVAVLMAHNYEADREALRRLLGSRCRYVGVLGPKLRTADLLKELAPDGSTLDREMLDRIYAPVGLDIGAASPESIALSIVAEIQAVLSKREGGHLRNRAKPIYDR